MNIRCAHCKGRHETVAAVKLCSQVKIVQPVSAASVTPVITKTIAKQMASKPGMYKCGDDVFLITRTKDGTKIYAKKLVATMKGDKLHKLHFEYEKGAIFQINAEDKMTLEEVSKLGKTTGHCWVCAKVLKVQKSIDAGIGPVCIKKV
jgi:hypothetical protein